MTRPALFLDRDGVINVDHAYVWRREDFQFLPGIFPLCRLAKASGYLLFVITNQAGIGRGLYSEADFLALTDWMCGRFEQEGCALDAVYFCPTHPEHGLGDYKRVSDRRKPAPGMILDALAAFPVDLADSVLVGDKPSDIAAGLAAGVGHNWLLADAAEPPPVLAATPGTRIIHSLEAAGLLLGELAGRRGEAPSG